MYEKGLVESGGGSGSGGSVGWRAGSDMGLKGLRSARGAPIRPSSSAPAAEPSYPSSATARADYLKGQVDQSVRDAGGYPTRGGKPMMTRMQQRMEARKAAAENEPVKKREPFKFRKGGMVGRDYGK
jgi:hypothetical protein